MRQITDVQTRGDWTGLEPHAGKWTRVDLSSNLTATVTVFTRRISPTLFSNSTAIVHYLMTAKLVLSLVVNPLDSKGNYSAGHSE